MMATAAHSEFPDHQILDFIVSEETLKVVVARPSRPLSLNHVNVEKSYFLPTTGTKGLALILNISQFDKESNRKGSSIDVNYLSDLLTQLDYKLFPESKKEREKPRKSKEEMQNFIHHFISRCNEETPESAIVFLGSHGEHPFLISTSDSKSLDLYRDIVNEFSHEKCPGLKGKPKMFFVQACQLYPRPKAQPTTTLQVESQEEPGVENETGEGDVRLKSREVIQIDSKDNPLWRPTIEDVLICTAVMPGQGAQRDPHKGSWFPYCLTYILMRYALKLKSLQNMLDMVDKMLENIKAVGSAVQVPVVTQLKFKTLYFCGIPPGNHGENVKKYCGLPLGLQGFPDGVGPNAKWSIVATVNSHITSCKIIDNLKNYRFVEWEEFALSFSSKRCDRDYSEDVVEVVTNCTLKNLKRLSKVNLDSYGRSVVLVISEDEKIIKDLVGKLAPWKSRVEIISDDLTWEDLTLAHQDKVNEKLSTHFHVEVENGKLNGKLLADLITGKDIELFKDTIPEQLSYYVGRTVLTRSMISNSIFERDDQSSPDIFVISGINRYHLSSLVKNEMTGTSSDYLRGRTKAKFLALDNESPTHLERIFDHNGVPIHLLHYRDVKLQWMKSKGELAIIQRYVDSESQEECKEADFCSSLASDSNSPICISDGPGMGKSVLLAEFARKLCQLFPERLVFYLTLREIMEGAEKLKLDNNSVNAAAVVKILSKIVCENIIGDAALTSKLQCQDRVEIELLLDGLDEVDSSASTTGLSFMNLIRTCFKSVRIWVTTRPHLLVELENNLKVLGYNIQPFKEEDQVQFLTTFWLGGRPDSDKEKIQHFARSCLKGLKDKMNSVDQDIAGIPLLCLLIGEVYQEDAEEFAESDQNQPAASRSHIEISSVTKLYDKMIDNRMTKYKTLFGQSTLNPVSNEKKPGLLSKLLQICIWNRFDKSSESSNVDEHLDEQKLNEMHARLALAEIFPTYLEKLEGLLVPIKMHDVLKVGIVTVSNSTNNPAFIHRTFAEYFVAWFLTDKLTSSGKWTEELTHFLLNRALGRQTRIRYIRSDDTDESDLLPPQQEQHEVFKPTSLVEYSFSKPVLCYFLNSMLDDCILDDIPKHVSYSLSSSSGDGADRVKEIAVACICSDFVNMFKLFVEPVAIFNTHFLLKAVEKSSLELIKILISNLEQSSPSCIDWKEKALKWAIHRGEFCIVEFLIKEKGLREIIKEYCEREYASELMFMLLLNSKHVTGGITEQKREVLRMLDGINPGLKETKDARIDETPLLFGTRDRIQANVKLLIELVSLGADVLTRSKDDETVLHLAKNRNNLSKSGYHSLLMSIHTDKLKILGQVRNKNGDTPLMTLVSFMDPDPETLEMFLVTRSNFNCLNGEGYSALALAIKYGRSKVTIVKLLSCNADPNWKGKKGESLLHVAAWYGHAEAVKILVDEYQLDPTVMDEEGVTLLDYVTISESYYGNRYETGLAISQRGGKLKDDYPWLHVAAKEGNLESVRLLISMGENVNGLDSEGNTPLHHAFVKKWEEVMENYEDHCTTAWTLVEGGANPNILNGLGETAFHTALKWGEMSMSGFRLLWSKIDITGMSSSCATLALPSVVLEAVNLLKDGEDVMERFARQCKKPRLVLVRDPQIEPAEEAGTLEFELRTVPEKALHYLIEEKWANPKYIFGPTRQTLLHKAAQGIKKDVNLKIIKYLIEHGTEVDGLNLQNQTFLHTYISHFQPPSPANFHNLVEFLLARNSSYSSLFNIPDGEFGRTPLHLAMCYLELMLETLELLHSTGAVFTDIDKAGNSLFAYAIMGEQRKDLLSFLIEHGADYKYINDDTKCNMLHIAVEAGNLDALNYLREAGGVNVNHVDGNGCTPLDIALRNGGGKTMIEWLVQNGAIALRSDDPPFKSMSKARNMNMRRNSLLNIHSFNPAWHDWDGSSELD